ncbi:unnamed protein product [Mytilus edulis]|uniref:C2H2-type domain-containing protein n=1 Tax=Mytilus edulis TaxID=6550 RepID=A0A8S3SZR9_MYTED|nr:unnamed protein product [Mytilus edulis]
MDAETYTDNISKYEIDMKASLKDVEEKTTSDSSEKRELENETKIENSRDKPFSCITCNKGFRTKQSLNAHMKRHDGFKPHICEVCHKRFVDKGDLKKHLRIHSGEKPYRCNICGRTFRFSSSRQSTAPSSGVNMVNTYRKCYEYNNKGACMLPQCRYIHKCLKCNGSHPAINCRVPQNGTGSRRGNFRPFNRTNFRQTGSGTDAGRQIPFIRNT